MEDNNLKYLPFGNISNEQKDELVKTFVEITAKNALQLFLSLGLKSHFESMVINETTGDEYILSFKKINN